MMKGIPRGIKREPPLQAWTHPMCSMKVARAKGQGSILFQNRKTQKAQRK